MSVDASVRIRLERDGMCVAKGGWYTRVCHTVWQVAGGRGFDELVVCCPNCGQLKTLLLLLLLLLL